MKKLNLLIGLILFATAFINAQEISNHAIGLRLGDDDGLGAEISYQKKIGDANRIEAGLAWRNHTVYSALKVTGLYQWVWSLDAVDGMNWYAGAGGGFGSWNIKSDYIGDGGSYLFAAGNIGAEYKFDIPLLVSLDFRPEIGFSDFNDGLGVDIALGVRYTFD